MKKSTESFIKDHLHMETKIKTMHQIGPKKYILQMVNMEEKTQI